MGQFTHLSDRDEDRLIRILRKLTPQQQRFVAVRPHCDSDAEAAIEAGIPPQTVWRWPQRVHTAVRLMAGDGVIASYELLRSALPKAAMRKIDALDSLDERIQQAAATEILDRFHGRPAQKNELSGTVAVTGDLSDDERVARLVSLLDAARARRDGQAAESDQSVAADGTA